MIKIIQLIHLRGRFIYGHTVNTHFHIVIHGNHPNTHIYILQVYEHMSLHSNICVHHINSELEWKSTNQMHPNIIHNENSRKFPADFFQRNKSLKFKGSGE